MAYEVIIIMAILGIFVIVARKIPNTQKEKIAHSILNKKGKSPTKFTTLSDKAESSFANGDYLNAEKAYIELASYNPEDYKLYNRLGIIYLEQRNYSDAKEAFEVTIKLGGTKAGRYYNLALACVGLQEFRNAKEAIDQALELDKENQKYLDMKFDLNKRLKKFKLNNK